MKMPSRDEMRDALRLTTEGRLKEATALIQHSLAARRRDQPAADAPKRRNGGPSRASWLYEPRGAPRREPAPPGRPATPPGDFDERTFSSEAGTRRYKLYVPSGYGASPRPLVVMLHGCTQSPDDFAAGTRMNEVAEAANVFVAYPEQPRGANMSKCWNWFRTGDQHRDRGEPSLIAGITRQIMREYRIDSRKVFVAGLSAGGAAAAIMGHEYPDLYAAVGVHSGLACGAAHDLQSAMAAMRSGSPESAVRPEKPVRTIVFHGTADRTVHPANADRVIAQAVTGRERVAVTNGRTAGGMAYTRKVLGRGIAEEWILEGAGHAWAGGSPAGTYADPAGPDASREMMRFFLER
jgi:poly(hydroxyalkanoate) depolymerase family esterase